MIEIHDIPHGQIEPSPDNPNQMDDETLAALKDDIRRRGFIQPILVRPVGEGRYRLIDGEHRWRVLGELGAETVPCVVEEVDETSAKVRMLTMNRLRGEFVPVRLAHLLADLANRVQPDEIGKRLGMSKAELAELLDLGGWEPAQVAPELDTELMPTPDPESVEVKIVARPEQAETIRGLLKGLSDEEQALQIIAAAKPGSSDEPTKWQGLRVLITSNQHPHYDEIVTLVGAEGDKRTAALSTGEVTTLDEREYKLISRQEDT